MQMVLVCMYVCMYVVEGERWMNLGRDDRRGGS